MQRPIPTEASDDPLSKWVHWVDQAIITAQQRGDFDNLPGHGKPLVIDDNPYAGDWAIGFHVLKNAGVKPLWMEVDAEIQAVQSEMQSVLDRLRRELGEASVVEVGAGSSSPPATTRPHSRWKPRAIRRRERRAADAVTVITRDACRSRAREEYVHLAGSLDQKVGLYNRALPAGLEHLERVRCSPEDAARHFDAFASAHKTNAKR